MIGLLILAVAVGYGIAATVWAVSIFRQKWLYERGRKHW